MAIIAFCKPTEEGARGALDGHGFTRFLPGGEKVEMQGPSCYWTKLTWVGLCVDQRERNMYHDSDFLMTVWDEEADTFREIEFASTRGWSYPCYGSWVDADEALAAKYKAHVNAKREAAVQARRKAFEDELRPMAEAAAVGLDRVDRLRCLLGEQYWALVAKLFNTKLRSDFRKSLRQQVINWLQEDEPKHRLPLSPKQLNFL